jgi:hypothetical protein
MSDLSIRLAKAYQGAFASKGRNKGLLKAACPPMGTDAGIMWQALMLYANPYKSGIGHLLGAVFLDPEFKTACDQFALNLSDQLPAADRDRRLLSILGAW